jgi:hypothetical protein
MRLKVRCYFRSCFWIKIDEGFFKHSKKIEESNCDSKLRIVNLEHMRTHSKKDLHGFMQSRLF